MADDGEAEGLAFEHSLQPLRPFDIDDLGGDANLGQLCGHDFTAATGIGRGRQVQRGGEPIRKTRLRQKRARLVGVIVRLPGQIHIGRIVRCKMGANGGAIAKHRPINDCLTVNRMGQRLADLHVVKGRLGVVGGQDRFPLGGADNHLKTRVCLKLDHVLRRGEVVKGVNVLGHHRSKGGGGIRDELDRGTGQLWYFAPVIWVAYQFDPVALHPFVEPVRASAHRRGFERLSRFLRHNHRIAPCKVEQEAAVGFRQGHNNRLRVGNAHIRDRGKQYLLRIGAVFGAGTIERELYVLSIHRGAVVKRHPLLQREGISQPVFGNLPGLRQQWHHRPIGGKARQPLKNIEVHNRVDGLGSPARRVQMRRLQLGGIGHGILGHRGGCQKGQRRCGCRKVGLEFHRLSSSAGGAPPRFIRHFTLALFAQKDFSHA